MTPAFEEVSHRAIPELATEAKRFRHRKTGAEALFLVNADAAFSCAIAVRTPPRDCTGVAHILEHCVLSGSRNYPHRPFDALLRGSLQSYLNASTFPDFTIYPVASPHPQDFANLVDVYLDAVFFPKLTRETFEREGWRRAPDGTLQGVVLNEMTGHFASPLAVLAEQSHRALFLDGPYSQSCGGEPSCIPDLTHEALCAFHRTQYHPSNALVAYSGQNDVAGELSRLEQVFEAFGPQPADRLTKGTVVASPRTLTLGHLGARAASLSLNWAFAAPSDPAEKFGIELLCETLLGGSFAPLRRALIDADLCGYLTDSGFHDDCFPPRMTIGLEGVNPERVSEIADCVEDTLHSLLRGGLNESLIAAALNRLEFRRADRADTKRPHAIGMLLDAAKAWRLGQDPIDGLAFAQTVASLRAMPASHFAQLIEKQLLGNPHRARVLLIPAKEARVEQDTAQPSSSTGQESLAQLARPQSTDLPVTRLGLADMSRTAPGFALFADTSGSVPLLFHPRATNGLVHVDLAFDLAGVPSLPLAPLLGQVLSRSATSRRTTREMALRIGSLTGGLSVEGMSHVGTTSANPALRLVLHGRAFSDRAEGLFEILAELLCDGRFPDLKSLIAITAQEITRMQASILPRAHDMIDMRLRCHVDVAAHVADEMSGLGHLTHLHRFAALLASDPDRAMAVLHDLRARLFCRERLVIAFTSEPAAEGRLATLAERLAARLAVGGADPADASPLQRRCSEAFAISGAANHIGCAFDLRQPQWAKSGALAVAGRCLETGWLRQKLRDEGGAYGALCRTDPLRGVVSCLSYRDPRLLASLDVMARAGCQLSKVDPADVTPAIISAIGALDRPLSAQASARRGLTDWLCGWTEAHRQAYRDEILSTRSRDLAELGAALADAGQSPHRVVFAPAEAISQAMAERPGLFERRALLVGE